MGMLKWWRSVSIAVMVMVLTACSGSGALSTHLTLRASATGIKTITFSWPAYQGATYYHLLVNPDGVSGYTQVGGDITATKTEVEVPVHLTDWVNARYIVEAYDPSGLLSTSSPISIASVMLDTIGYLKASNTDSNDLFGYRVALSGDGNTLAIAAAGESSDATGIDGAQQFNLAPGAGAVYLFVHTATGWQQQAYIKASNTDANDAFGSSLALSNDGNTLAVGAIGEDSDATGINGNQLSNLASNSGAVYLFTRTVTLTSTTWTQQAYIKASNTGSGDVFGVSVAMSSDGNTLAVGASGEDSGSVGINGVQNDETATDSGAVYLFTRSGVIWSQQAYLKASNTESGDLFGVSLSLSGDGNTLAVGATGEDSDATGINGNQTSNVATNAGAVYLFIRSVSTWSQQAYIKASNSDVGDSFGGSVALSGDSNTLAVGAAGEDSSATGVGGIQNDELSTNSGAVYLFTRSGVIWTQQAYIKASNTDLFDNFGSALSLSSDGNLLAVSAPYEDSAALGVGGDELNNDALDSGALYTYRRTAGVWSWQNYIKAPNAETSDFFGYSLALSSDGNTLTVGAVGEDSAALGIGGAQADNTLSSAGAAYLY